jgi:hypothetical protein
LNETGRRTGYSLAKFLPVLFCGKATFKAPSMRRRFFRLLALVAIAASVAAFSSASHAQAPSTGPSIDYQKSGIRFQIVASVKAAPDAPYGKPENDKSRASVDVKLRISAHANESNYFGLTTVSFSDFRIVQGSEEKLYWQDDRCHQRRGLPKITVTAVDGFIQTDKSRIDIAAKPRQIGKLVPGDEISAGTRLPGGVDKNGPFIAFSSRTNTSHLVVQVKVYTIDCPLTGTAP